MSFNSLKNMIRIDFNKNTKLFFYIRGLYILSLPKFLYGRDLHKEFQLMSETEKTEILKRVEYYNKVSSSFKLPKDAITIFEYIKKEKMKTYFFDLLEYLKYFNYKNKITYIFGDVIDVPKIPSFVKSRPISDGNENSIILKLNKVRHFIFVNDSIKFEDKINKAVWRGKSFKQHRIDFIKRFYNSPLCDIGQVNNKGDLNVPWQKEKLSLKKQMQYKFIVAIEGNDVASNLKWAMSSNSLVMMAKPKYETWFMEGTLVENYHYVLLKDDYSDLEGKIKYYLSHIEEAKVIIENANNYVKQFKNKTHEDIISYFVIEKYFKQTNVIELNSFKIKNKKEKIS